MKRVSLIVFILFPRRGDVNMVREISFGNFRKWSIRAPMGSEEKRPDFGAHPAHCLKTKEYRPLRRMP
jgi:hypothetical protein